MKTLPEKLEEHEDNYSNFDHEMPKNAEKLLKAKKLFITHSAYDHCGYMWFEDGQFHQEVWRYKSHITTISGDTLKDVFDDVNDEYGHG